MLFRLVLVIACAALAAIGAPYSSLYFFGDSLTDTGNVAKATSVLHRYSFGLVPKHPSAPYDGGRFTNGPVWAEHVAANLGRPEDAQPAGMSMGWFGQVGGPGNNYAVGGARTDEGGAIGLLDVMLPTGVTTQVDHYLSRTQGIADASGLYFLMAGGNDIRDAGRLSDPTERLRAAHRAGANLAYSVRDLYLAGARNFVLINSPDVGLIPESIADGVVDSATDASVQFNSWLAQYAAYLQTVPEFSLQYFDIFGLHHELVAQYGLDAIRPCKDGPPETCDQTLFFDSVHPNARVHQIMGQHISDQLLQSSNSLSMMQSNSAAQAHTPEPSTLLLTIGALFLLLWRRSALQRRRAMRASDGLARYG